MIWLLRCICFVFAAKLKFFFIIIIQGLELWNRNCLSSSGFFLILFHLMVHSSKSSYSIDIEYSSLLREEGICNCNYFCFLWFLWLSVWFTHDNNEITTCIVIHYSQSFHFNLKLKVCLWGNWFFALPNGVSLLICRVNCEIC